MTTPADLLARYTAQNQLESFAQNNGFTEHVALKSSTESTGHVKIGNNIDVSNGTISLKNATTAQKGLVQLQTALDSSETTALTPKALNDHNNANMIALDLKRDKGTKITTDDIDKSDDSKKIHLLDLSEEVQAAMAGTAPVISSVADGSLTTAKYADTSVTIAKLEKQCLSANVICSISGIPNYNTTTKVFDFKSADGYQTVLVYGSESYLIPVGTTVTNGQASTATKLVFNVDTKAFSFIPYNTALGSKEVLLAVFRTSGESTAISANFDITIDDVSKVTVAPMLKPCTILKGGRDLPIVDSVAKTLTFPPTTYDTIIFVGEKYYLAPASTGLTIDLSTMVGTSAWCLLFNTTDKTFLLTSYSTAKNYKNTHALFATCRIENGRYIFNMPCPYILDGNLYGISLPDALDGYVVTDLNATNETAIGYQTSNNVLSFAAITDLHAEGTTLVRRLKHIKAAASCSDYGSVQFLCNLGDTIEGALSDKTVALANLGKAAKELKKQSLPAFMICGNHDDNSYSNGGSDPLATKVITKAEMYSRIIRPFESSGIVHDTNDNASLYYYRDFDKQKVRVIFLNSLDYPVITEPNGTLRWSGIDGWGFGNSQINWLASQALYFGSKGTDKSNWAVLVMCHMPTRLSLQNQSSIAPVNGDIIENIIKAFKNGSTYTGNGTTTDWTTSVNCDFTTQGTMEVIAFIHGHVHADNIQAPVDLGWPYISIADSSESVLPDAAKPTGSTVPSSRTIGTDTEDCWDIISINRTTKTINLSRYGAGSNRSVTY